MKRPGLWIVPTAIIAVALLGVVMTSLSRGTVVSTSSGVAVTTSTPMTSTSSTPAAVLDPSASALAAKQSDRERTGAAAEQQLGGLPQCAPRDISAAALYFGATKSGDGRADIIVTDTGARACVLGDQPTLQWLDAVGATLGKSQRPSATAEGALQLLELQPGDTTYLHVALSAQVEPGTSGCTLTETSGLRLTFTGATGSSLVQIGYPICAQTAAAHVYGVGQPSASAQSVKFVPACTIGQFEIKVDRRSGSTQHWIYPVSLTNTAEDCYLQGTLEARWVYQGGELPVSTADGGVERAQPVVIVPRGTTAYAMFWPTILGDEFIGKELAQCAPATVQTWDLYLSGSAQSIRVQLAQTDQACMNRDDNYALEAGFANVNGAVAHGGIASREH